MNLVWCYHKETLSQILRTHYDDPILDQGEDTARQSFDALLDFFGKLGYLIWVGLIKADEIVYFEYYLLRMVRSEVNPVLIYSLVYDLDYLPC